MQTSSYCKMCGKSMPAGQIVCDPCEAKKERALRGMAQQQKDRVEAERKARALTPEEMLAKAVEGQLSLIQSERSEAAALTARMGEEGLIPPEVVPPPEVDEGSGGVEEVAEDGLESVQEGGKSLYRETEEVLSVVHRQAHEHETVLRILCELIGSLNYKDTPEEDLVPIAIHLSLELGNAIRSREEVPNEPPNSPTIHPS